MTGTTSGSNPLLGLHRYFRRGPVSEEGWSQLVAKDRRWESTYRGRWSHDKVVRSTHGVNCTGSCSWKVYVKDGLVTWETQATDYPETGPDMPEYEPRGCPRGASFSWYVYSPLRLKRPYVRGTLLTRGRRSSGIPRSPAPTKRSADAAGSCGRRGTTRWT
jgi:nitrate reductase alpha subunit